jgi:hypothetical protein
VAEAVKKKWEQASESWPDVGAQLAPPATLAGPGESLLSLLSEAKPNRPEVLASS